ncbi:MAG: 16S rRNA (uracil(1498)-N(3))-methyltransferase [Porticoccaceae bacterium]|nr:16S rRNA (uracil(1498)-N(3))-methyltransferase [Porticoccaceae bacterium]
MNLLLLEDNDFVSEGIAEISGRRYEHIVNILKPDPGGTIKTGLINGNTGIATVLVIEKTKLKLKVDLLNEPEPPLPVTLLLALPRPKMLKRILQTCAALGVNRLYLINSYRVEKSYWQSPWLETKAIDGQLRLGLEQAGTTTLPQVELRKRFKPFVEDELDTIAGKTTRLLAHPYHHQPAPVSLNQASTLAVGPEGGFIAYEIDKLVELGFTPVSLGKRILKVETAVTALLSRLYT